MCDSDNHLENLTEKSPETSEPAAISQLALPPILLASPLCCGHRPKWARAPRDDGAQVEGWYREGVPRGQQKGDLPHLGVSERKDLTCVHELDGRQGHPDPLTPKICGEKFALWAGVSMLLSRETPRGRASPCILRKQAFLLCSATRWKLRLLSPCSFFL